MRYPIFVQRLIELARSFGVEQQDIARRLKVPNSAVSQWATGTRPIPRRHLPGFIALISELIRAHDTTHRNQIRDLLRLWNVELYVRGNAFSTHVREMLQTLRSSYAQDDIMKLSREERRSLRKTCERLAWYFGYLDNFEEGISPGPVTIPETSEENFARLRQWYGVDEAEE